VPFQNPGSIWERVIRARLARPQPEGRDCGKQSYFQGEDPLKRVTASPDAGGGP
jgi:hypothetical protein